MELFSESQSHKLYHGNMLNMLDVIEPNSIDAIVTDPPYELNFMGKNWDNSGIAFQKETWEKCLKVLTPGGYLLSFGGSRTFHRIACAIEDAGFEIRDTIMYLYGSGFPKSMNIGLAIDKKNDIESEVISEVDFPDIRVNNYGNNDGTRIIVQKKYAQNEWQGWGTALKPAYEPIIVARKPCEGSCIDNVLKYGVGGINIDECRIGTDIIKGGTTPNFRDVGRKQKEISGADKLSFGQVSNAERISLEDHTGRFPANVILTYDDTDFQEVCGGMPSGGANGSVNKTYAYKADVYGDYKKKEPFDSYGDSGSAARYFYCAKASKRDRDEGLPEGKHNIHPTVKNTMLMQYLIRLVTPKGGTILDPFNGSGSTGKAAMYENKDRNAGYKYIGIELTSEYLPIADARIRFALGDTSPVEYPSMPVSSPKAGGQISLFDIT